MLCAAHALFSEEGHDVPRIVHGLAKAGKVNYPAPACMLGAPVK
jgi:hypothetical protein